MPGCSAKLVLQKSTCSKYVVAMAIALKKMILKHTVRKVTLTASSFLAMLGNGSSPLLVSPSDICDLTIDQLIMNYDTMGATLFISMTSSIAIHIPFYSELREFVGCSGSSFPAHAKCLTGQTQKVFFYMTT